MITSFYLVFIYKNREDRYLYMNNDSVLDCIVSRKT